VNGYSASLANIANQKFESILRVPAKLLWRPALVDHRNKYFQAFAMIPITRGILLVCLQVVLQDPDRVQ
jgi:hypothetical protein